MQEDFSRHWREVHAPLAIRHAKALRIKKYVQLHARDCEAARLMTQSRQCQPPHDGVCQIWWDSEEDRLAASRSLEGLAASRELHEDELRFCDMARSATTFGYENTVIDNLPHGADASKLFKMSFAVYRRPDLTPQQFRDYWRTVHAGLAVKYADIFRIRKYVQLHAYDGEAANLMTASRQSQPPNDGVVELWWDSEDERLAAARSPEGQVAGKVMLEDELRFCDMARASVAFGYEHRIV